MQAHYIDPRMCKNGDLIQKGNIADGSILYICVAGVWKTLCPKLWGPTQATVACRQLNPEKVVTGKTYPYEYNTHMYENEKSNLNAGYKKYTTNIMNPTSFMYHFICDGSEQQISDCVLSNYQVHNNLCNENKVTSLICETGIANLK